MESQEDRRKRREMKAARGDFREPKAVVLVRGADGKPKFDSDPRKLPAEVQKAYRAHMTAAEQKEFFK